MTQLAAQTPTPLPPTPQLNVTWVKELLPYLNQADPKVVGELFRGLLPALQGVSEIAV